MDISEIKRTIGVWYHSTLVRKFVAGSFWMIVARCAWIVGALSVGIIVARKLGPHDFGLVSYAVAYAGLFSVIAGLGVDSIVERDFILYPEKRNRILGNYFLFKLVMTGIMLICVAVSLCFFQDKEQMLLCLIVSSGYLFCPLNAVLVVFPCLLKSEYNAFAQLATCLCYNGVRIVAVLCSSSLYVYAVAEALLFALNCLFFFIIYWCRCGNPLLWRGSLKEAMKLLLPAISLSMTMIFSTVCARTDILMLDYYKGAAAVGCYSIATRITENCYLFTLIPHTVFYMALINALKVSRAEYDKQLHRYYFIRVYCTLPLIAATLLLGKPLIVLLYGQAYLESFYAVRIFILTLLPTAAIGAFCSHAVSGNRLKTITFVYFSGLLLNVPMNMFFIQKMGLYGAALSSLLSLSLGFVITLGATAKGRADLVFFFYSLTHWPSFRLNEEKRP